MKRGAEHNAQEMTFLEHLEELRWVIIRSGAFIMVAALGAWFFAEWLMNEVLIRPLHVHFPGYELIYLKPAGAFLALISISLWAALIVTMPYLAWEVWRFIAPGLFQKERRMLPAVMIVTVICFMAGALLAYLVVLPIALRFFLSIGSDVFRSQIEVKEYLSFSLRLILAFGVVFELPVLSFFLARLGILTAGLMRKIRAYAIFGISILAAFITPPDPASMLMLMGPLVLLYEISIWVAVAATKRREKTLP
jgi:sec-independent protein translocase protein TatC